jgi:hypothetical protein
VSTFAALQWRCTVRAIQVAALTGFSCLMLAEELSEMKQCVTDAGGCPVQTAFFDVFVCVVS